MVPHFQCILISLEEATQSTPEEADLITEHTEALFKEQKKKKHAVRCSLRGWKEFCRFPVPISREVKVIK